MARISLTENAKIAAYKRFQAGWTDWRGIYGTPHHTEINRVSEKELLQDRVEWLEMENEMLRAEIDE